MSDRAGQESVDPYEMLAHLCSAMRENVEVTATCLAATTALVAAVSEEMPGLVPRYQQLLAALESTSPRVAQIRASCDGLDRIVQRLKRAKQ